MQRNSLFLSLLLFATLLSLLAAPLRAQDDPELAQPRRVATGFVFTEGPALAPDGSLYFSDVRASKIHRLRANGEVSTVRTSSGRANGLMFALDGSLIACQGGTGRVVAMSPSGELRKILAESYNGKRFNAPNDLVIDRHGGIYFTDPEYGRDIQKPQGTFAVYYIRAPGKVTRIIESLPRPNGILLSTDERTLYVVPSHSSQVRAYPILAPGKIGPERVFCELKQAQGRSHTGGDGLTIDSEGRLYITSRLGIQIFDSKGKHLRTLRVPESVTNCTFGPAPREGEKSILFVTAQTSVYAFELDAQGHVFGQPPAGFDLVWRDEFEQDGPFDKSRWTWEKGLVRNNEAQWYQEENARCVDGKLVIEARRERTPNPGHRPGSQRWQERREFSEYTSACIKTQGKASWRYGIFELRARIPTAPGCWPAWWAMGVQGEWPDCGEIDMMEYFKGELLANAAWGSGKRWSPVWDATRKKIASFADPDWAERFHIWRMDWDPKRIRLYVDDELLNEIDLSKTHNVRRYDNAKIPTDSSDTTARNPFHQPHYMLLNLAIGGSSGGDPSKTVFPQRLEVDYVRVFQRRSD
jgi:sugar lactone lactonase YvrE/beta-glucanase (GH16 family)